MGDCPVCGRWLMKDLDGRLPGLWALVGEGLETKTKGGRSVGLGGGLEWHGRLSGLWALVEDLSGDCPVCGR